MAAFEVVTAFVVLFGISLAVPFLADLEYLMALFIIGIGLYEAWQLNRRVDMKITGPHKLGALALTPAPDPPAGQLTGGRDVRYAGGHGDGGRTQMASSSEPRCILPGAGCRR